VTTNLRTILPQSTKVLTTTKDIHNEIIAAIPSIYTTMETLSESTSSNGSANESSNTLWAPPQTRRRNVLNDAATMIGNGGLGHPSHAHSQTSTPSQQGQFTELNDALDFYEKQFLPRQPRSLSGIALRSFTLGLTLSLSTLLSIYLLVISNLLWRAPFFVAILSLFHFLEFYTTALANTSDAKVSSFLLSSNGSAYTIAHTAAFTECILSHVFLPSMLPSWAHYLILVLGLAFILIGQLSRSLAMLQAGPNFSHLIRHTKSPTHVLITTGVYSLLRHPSYFGFFWWGIGTQLVCGNTICLMGYAAVLWKFFSRRIEGEEGLLVKFFGQEYVEYRKRTRVGIPFI
jgi:protein-S-isoprenylcysteine O-methyltransferase